VKHVRWRTIISLVILGAIALVIAMGYLFSDCEVGPQKAHQRQPELSPLPTIPVHSPVVPDSRPVRRAVLKEPMEEIAKVAKEMSRRAQGRVSMQAPAMLLLKLLNKLPAESYPATFQTDLKKVKHRAKILKDSNNLCDDFNSLIDSCHTCHMSELKYFRAGRTPTLPRCSN